MSLILDGMDQNKTHIQHFLVNTKVHLYTSLLLIPLTSSMGHAQKHKQKHTYTNKHARARTHAHANAHKNTLNFHKLMLTSIFQVDEQLWKLKTHVTGVLVDARTRAYAYIDACEYPQDPFLSINLLVDVLAREKAKVSPNCSCKENFHYRTLTNSYIC